MVLRPHCELTFPAGCISTHNVIEKFDSFTTRQQVFACLMDRRVGSCVCVCTGCNMTEVVKMVPPGPLQCLENENTCTAAMRGIMFSCVQVGSLCGPYEVIASVML